MTLLKNKKILLAITGSIAAYKTPHLVRLLVKQGAEVKVIITEAAATMVSPLALSTVSKHSILGDISSGSEWNNHVALGYWADVMLIAPASANTLGHLAHGLCNNLIHAVYLSAKCPVIIAPAMDADMWEHPAVKENFNSLRNRAKHYYIPVEHGELASGLIGAGRMAEPENIVIYLEEFFANSENEIYKDQIHRKKAIVTAGPTYEMLDPVRFIGNFSSGKMGIAVAHALVHSGYEVELIVGPGVQFEPSPHIHLTRITSALELKAAIDHHFDTADITVMAAAVADFRPATKAEEKIKKGQDTTMEVQLVKNPDILQYLGTKKRSNQILVGFALETENELSNAQAKLVKKNADYIALNSLKDEGVAFGADTNKVTLLCKDGHIESLPLLPKMEIAQKMINFILQKESE